MRPPYPFYTVSFWLVLCNEKIGFKDFFVCNLPHYPGPERKMWQHVTSRAQPHITFLKLLPTTPSFSLIFFCYD